MNYLLPHQESYIPGLCVLVVLLWELVIQIKNQLTISKETSLTSVLSKTHQSKDQETTQSLPDILSTIASNYNDNICIPISVEDIQGRGKTLYTIQTFVLGYLDGTIKPGLGIPCRLVGEPTTHQLFRCTNFIYSPTFIPANANCILWQVYPLTDDE